MTTIKIEFPADRRDIAEHFGVALLAIAGGTVTVEREEVLATSPKPSLFDTEDGSAEDAAEAGQDEQTTEAAGSPAGASDRLDEHGVPFDAAFCGASRDNPFYATGKTAGQWKKRRGVDQTAYDEWYAGALAGVEEAPVAAPDPAPVNVGGAFGGPATVAADPAEETPTTVEQLMVWISGKQADGVLSQEDVNQAHEVTRVTMADLFAPNAAPGIAQVHTYLVAAIARR